MADTLNFGPEWLRNLSSGGGSVASPPPSPAVRSSIMQYGKEIMLQTYKAMPMLPRMKYFMPDPVLEHPQDPINMKPISEQEQMLMNKPINSHAVLKTMRSDVRGGPPVRGRGGSTADRGRGRGRGGGSMGRIDYSRGPYDEAPDGYNSNRYYRSDSYDDPRYGTEGVVSPRRIDYSRSMSSDNWRRRGEPDENDSSAWRRRPDSEEGDGWRRRGKNDGNREGRIDEDDSGEWRVQRGQRHRPASQYDIPEEGRPLDTRGTQNRNWRTDGGGQRGGGGRYDGRPRFTSQRSRDEQHYDDEQPEWSLPDDAEPGTFDSSGAFVAADGRERDRYREKPHDGKEHSDGKNENHMKNAKTEAAGEPVIPIKNNLSAPSTQQRPDPQHKPPADFTHLQNAAENILKEDSASDGIPSQQKTQPASFLSSTSSNSLHSSGPINTNLSATTAELAQMSAGLNSRLGSMVAPAGLNTAPQPPQEEKWFYKDPQGSIQGPFPKANMYKWFKAGYFDMTLLIRQGTDGDFKSLGEVIRERGAMPFTEESSPQNNSPVSQHSDGSPKSTAHNVPEPVNPASTVSLADLATSAANNPTLPSQTSSSGVSSAVGSAGAVPNDPLHPALMQQHFLQQQQMLFRQQQLLLSNAIQYISSNEQYQQLSPAQQHQLALDMVLTQQMATLQQNTSAIGSATSGAGDTQPATNWPSSNQVNSVSSSELSAGSSWSAESNNTAAVTDGTAAPNAWQTRSLEAAKKAAQEKNAEEEEARRVEEARIQEEQRMREEHEARRAEEARRIEEERRKEEEMRLEALRQQRLALEAQRKLEEERLQEEMRKNSSIFSVFFEAEEDRRQREEQARLETERRERARLEEERRKQAEEEARFEQMRLEELRLQEEKKKKEAEERHKQEETKRALLEEERRKRAELKRKQQAAAKQMANMQLPSAAQWASNTTPVAEPEGRSLQEIQRAEAEEQLRQQRENEEQMRAMAMHAPVDTGSKSWAPPAAQSSGPSLKEIQQEQEKQNRNSTKTQQQQHVASLPLATASIWSGSTPSSLSTPQANSTTPWAASSTKAPSPSSGSTSKSSAAAGFWDDPPPRVSAPSKKTKQHESSFPALGAGSGGKQKHKSQAAVSQAQKTKEQALVQNLFSQKKSPEDEFEHWCLKRIEALNNSMDSSTFYEILKATDSPYEVHDYVRQFLGETKQAMDFAKEFLEKRSQQRSAERAAKQKDDQDDLWGPAPAVKPAVVASPQKPQQPKKQAAPPPQPTGAQAAAASAGAAKKKKKGGRMQKVDNRILGFMVHADSSRTNVGEIEHA